MSSAKAVQKTKLKKHDAVWVPAALVQKQVPTYPTDGVSAVVSGKIAGRVDADGDFLGVPRTFNVDVPGVRDQHGVPYPIPIPSRHLRRHSKILIVRIGDWETEQTSLNPLAESLKTQLNLLLPPGEVDVEFVRSLTEFADALRVHGGGPGGAGGRSPWGYAVLVGHGRSGDNAGIRFGHDWHTPKEIVKGIKGLGPGRRSFGDGTFLSLCCSTGKEDFARSFSDDLGTYLLGPKGSVHVYEAAGFAHRFFFEHFLSGKTQGEACAAAKASTANYSTTFQLWGDGKKGGA